MNSEPKIHARPAGREAIVDLVGGSVARRVLAIAAGSLVKIRTIFRRKPKDWMRACLFAPRIQRGVGFTTLRLKKSFDE